MCDGQQAERLRSACSGVVACVGVWVQEGFSLRGHGLALYGAHWLVAVCLRQRRLHAVADAVAKVDQQTCGGEEEKT